MPRAELHHFARALNTKPRLQRSRLIIDAAVDDPAVMSRLMPGHARFFFQDHQPQVRELFGRLHGKRKPHHPAANHRDVIHKNCLIPTPQLSRGLPEVWFWVARSASALR